MDLRKQLGESRSEAEQAMDILRRSFEGAVEDRRAARERIKERHAERARHYWQEAGEANDNPDNEGA
jgi:hypothetical protein